MGAKLLRAAGLVVALCVGAVLFLGDRDLPADELRAKYTSEASRFQGLPSGAQIHMRDEGKTGAPVLLLVHGSNASLHTWEPWVALLGKDLRVVSVDLPGHGLTGPVPGEDYSRAGMAETLEEFRRAAGIERWSIAGNSMGGGVAWEYARRYPEKLDALILVDSVGPMPPDAPVDVPIAFRIAQTPVLNRTMEYFLPRAVIADALRNAFADPSLVDEAMIDRYHELELYPGTRRASRIRFSNDDSLEIEASLFRDIRTPTLVMWGVEDRLVDRTVGVLLDQSLPNSKHVEYPNVGHLPHEEHPERSAADVLGFLRDQGVL